MGTPRPLFGHRPKGGSAEPLILSCFFLAGCGGTALQLEQATDSLSDTVPHMISAQIFHNLLLKEKDINELPAQVVIGGGSAQISNQLIIPSATANLTGVIFRSFGLQN